MRVPKYEFHAPSTLEEANSLLARFGPEALIVAGGTDSVPRIKQGLVAPRHFVSLNGLKGLSYIEEDSSGIRIGATTTLAMITRNNLVSSHVPILARAASLIGAPQHQAMGTVGGNICLEPRCHYYNQSSEWRRSIEPCLKVGGKVCHMARASKKCLAVYSADLAPALILLDAELVISGPGGERDLPIRDFFLDDGLRPNVLQDAELIREIRLPMPAVNEGWAYAKYRPRDAVDFPVLGIAVRALPGQDTSVKVRVAMTAASSRPFETSGLEFEATTDQGQVVARLDEIIDLNVKPTSRVGGSVGFKRKIAIALARDALREALERIGGK